MKKHAKKLSLNRETVLALSSESLEKAAGGTTHPSAWSNCYCTNGSACCSNECGTQLCW